MVLVKNWPFFHGFFFGNTGQENVFYNILERKNVFLRYKNKKFKKWKNCPFFKRGKSMVLVKNWPFFLFFFKGKIGQENVFYDIVERKKAFLGYKNKNFKKWKNCHFSKEVSPCYWSKIDHFSIFFVKGNIGQDNVFYDILDRRNAFLGYMNKKFKKWKNCDFWKWVNPWFWSKIGHFSKFFPKAI